MLPVFDYKCGYRGIAYNFFHPVFAWQTGIFGHPHGLQVSFMNSSLHRRMY